MGDGRELRGDMSGGCVQVEIPKGGSCVREGRGEERVDSVVERIAVGLEIEGQSFSSSTLDMRGFFPAQVLRPT